MEDIIGQGGSSPSGHIPFTPRAKKVLELSLREALQLGHNYIGTEHILLGLVREGDGVGAQVLALRDIGLSDVKERVIATLEAGGPHEAIGPSPLGREGVSSREPTRLREAGMPLGPWVYEESVARTNVAVVDATGGDRHRIGRHLLVHLGAERMTAYGPGAADERSTGAGGPTDLVAGTDRRAAAGAELVDVAVLVVLIDGTWSAAGEHGRRPLDDLLDPTRLAVEAGFEAGMAVVPVLIDGADLPAIGDLPASIDALGYLVPAAVGAGDRVQELAALVEAVEHHLSA